MSTFQARILQQRFLQEQLYQRQLLRRELLHEQILGRRSLHEGLAREPDWLLQREREAQAWHIQQQAAIRAEELEQAEQAARQQIQNSVGRLHDKSKWTSRPAEDRLEEDDRSQYTSDSPPKYQGTNINPPPKSASPSLTIHHCVTCYNQHLDQGVLDSWNEEELGVEAAEQLTKDRGNLEDVDMMVQSQHKKNQACRVTICFCGNLHLCPGWDECRTEQHKMR